MYIEYWKKTLGGGKINNKKLLLIILIIGVITCIISTFFYQLCVVHGDSMNPTLKNGRIVLIKKYNLVLKNNDIVVIKKNDKIIIKRLIGIPNDTIKIDKYVYVNDNKFDDIITQKNGDISLDKILLTNDEYFVLGDNRQNSIDSRFSEIGIIKKDEIIGKVLF